MQVWKVLHAARCKCRTQKSRQKSPSGHHPTTLSGYISSQQLLYRQSEKNLLSSNISPTCPQNMVNFGPLVAEIISLVWGTPGNFNGFRVLAAKLQRWTEGATYMWQSGHHVGHWPTFLVLFKISALYSICTICRPLVLLACTKKNKINKIWFK